MSTRLRAIITSSITSLLVFLSFIDVEAVDYRSILNNNAIDASIFTYITALSICLVLFAGVLWVLHFKRKGASYIAIGLFPSVAILPYILLIDNLVSSINNLFGAGVAALLATAIYWLVSYLLILTANVLNGAVLYNIPLGQAGKASQFTFSLISAYFLIVTLFGAGIRFEVRVVAIALFVFYLSFSTIWTLQVPPRQVILSPLAITGVMILTTIVLSVWPISAIYATLAAVIIFYIMLNVALEMREHVGRMIWVEYGLLLALILVILFTNGSWGINGPLL